jgi:hypothetical protein
VTLTTSRKAFQLDVSDHHILLGYKPLVVGIVFTSDSVPVLGDETVCLSFHHQPFTANSEWHRNVTDKNAVARLLLKKMSVKKFGATTVGFFTGATGEHHFIGAVQQVVNGMRQVFRKSKAGNVDLPGNLHDMVRIAYAVPRIISLFTVSDGKGINVFPTDLHGEVSPRFYMSSLRKDGIANQQVEQTRRVTLSTIKSSSFRMAYAAGKNHMQPFRPAENFSFSADLSETFRLPLPATNTGYRELILVDSFDAGIHRIHLYETVAERNGRQADTLSHIHQYYAQWRLDHDQPTKMLLR